MNFIFIHQHFYPEESGTAKSCTEMAEYFASIGHDVTIITEFPNRGFSSTADSKQEELKCIDTHKGIVIHRLKNRFNYSSKPISRISAYLMFTIQSSLYALKFDKKFDICITIQALPSAIPGVLVKKLHKIPHHFYCTDMMPDLGVVSGMIKNKLFIKFARMVEKYVYNHSTAIYAVTEQMVKNIKQKTSNKNVFELPDWVDDSFYKQNRYRYLEYLKKAYDLDGKKIILYIGNIGFVQNLSIVVKAARGLKRCENYKDFLFIIGGAGVKKDELENKCKEYGLDNIRFIGVVERKHVPSFLELSSILLMNYIDHPHMALYRSSKIFDYIVAEKPVIVGATGALKDIVEENQLGKVSSPSDPDEFLNKLIEVINTEWEIDNKHLIEKYSRETVLNNFYSRLLPFSE